MPDRRNPDRVQHSMRKMLMQRVSAIACGYAMRTTLTGCGAIP